MATPPVRSARSDFDQKREHERQRWRDRSRQIRFWRKALPVVIAGIAGLLVLWIGGRSLIVKLTSTSAGKDGQGVRMVNPRFYGRDSSNRAFVLGASEARRDLANARTVTLAGPNVTLDSDGVNPTRVEASRGIYREDQRRLTLDGGVQMKDGRGYNFTTPSAQVDTTTGQVVGNSGVKGDGPLGRITASSYAVNDRGKRIVMRGDVRARIVQ